jgi:hypothetical protein
LPHFDRKDSQREALRILRELLGFDRPDVGALVSAAVDTLGHQRTDRCRELIEKSQLTRRSALISALASLVVGTRKLGEGWWRRANPMAYAREGNGSQPDDILETGFDPGQRKWPTTLELLGQWMASDVADLLWGAPIDYVDLNSMQPSDRVAAPSGSRAGERLVLAFDPGSRVEAVVTRRSDGSPGTELDTNSIRHSPPAEVEWGWAIAGGIGPHRLPNEEQGSPRDPYGVPIDTSAALTLTKWAIARGESAQKVDQPWTTVGDAIRALEAMHMVGRDGSWHYWGQAVEALADRDNQKLAESLARLRQP